MTNVLRIAWIAVRELIYERVFYILLMFAIFALGMGILLGQLTYVQQTKLTLDFMLAGAQLSMVLFAVFMGIGLFKRELTMGSVSMVLSKPISRSTFLIGKFLGQVFVQFWVIAAMMLITLSVSIDSPSLSYVSIMQTGILIFFEVSVVTAITYFLAVNAGVVTTAVVTLSLFAIGHVKGSISSYMNYRGESTSWHIIRSLIPDLEIFNMKMLASYGNSITWVEFGWVSLYCACCLAFFLALALGCFSSKDVLT